MVCEGWNQGDWAPLASDGKDEALLFTLQVSFNLVHEFSSNSSMKLKGHIHERGVVVTIDLHTAHNFICTSYIRELQLPIDDMKQYNVMFGDGPAVKEWGICCDVPVQMEG